MKYLPKYEQLNTLSNEDVLNFENLLNNRPRKLLKY